MLSSFLTLLGFAATALGITVTTSTASYTIDSGDSDGFVVAVSRSTGDITSILYRGTQYQYQSTYSHIASGLGSAMVSYTTVGSSSPSPSFLQYDSKMEMKNWNPFLHFASLHRLLFCAISSIPTDLRQLRQQLGSSSHGIPYRSVVP